MPAAGSLTLNSAAVSAEDRVTKTQLDGGELEFTPAADENGAGYASFTFKVSDGTEESTATYTMTIDVTAVNDAPEGANRTVTTDEDTAYTFAAGDFGFTDGDGDALASVTVVTVPAAGSLTLDGTAVTADAEVTKAELDGGEFKFTPAADENGAGYASFTFKVSDGTEESAATYTMTVDVTAVQDVPTGADRTVTTDEDTAYTFAAGDFGFTDGDGDVLASVEVVTVPGAGSLTLNAAAVSAEDRVTKTQLDGGELEFTPAADENGAGYASFTFKVSDGTEESAATYTMTVDVTAVNDAPTGVPTISGAARVGQTLSASRTGIEDVDGLPGNESGYGYQWVRVDSGVETEISGATSRTYEVVTADEGKKLKVKVSYTDDGGTAEEVVSAETEAVGVGANTVPEEADRTVTTDEDTAYTFAAADFGFTDGDGEVLASVDGGDGSRGGESDAELGTAVTCRGQR